MPANLTPQYLKAEERYRQAKDDRERLTALREMLSTLPKHKGTEKMQADLKRRIAESGRTRDGGRAATADPPTRWSARGGGAAQVALVGPPNSGKSELRGAPGDPRESRRSPRTPSRLWTPTPGILVVEKVPIQVVDLPPVQPGHTEPWLADLLRNADLLLLLLDLSTDEVLEDLDRLRAALGAVRISLAGPPPEPERDPGLIHAKWVLAGNKVDLPGARARLALLAEAVRDRPVFAISLETGEGIPDLLGGILAALDVVRVYTKEPGKEADRGVPFVFPRGSRVEDAARAIHRDLAEHLKYARAWGVRFYGGQPVGRDVVLEDGDVLEFHAEHAPRRRRPTTRGSRRAAGSSMRRGGRGPADRSPGQDPSPKRRDASDATLVEPPRNDPGRMRGGTSGGVEGTMRHVTGISASYGIAFLFLLVLGLAACGGGGGAGEGVEHRYRGGPGPGPRPVRSPPRPPRRPSPR